MDIDTAIAAPSADCEGIAYIPIIRLPGKIHPILNLACRGGVDGKWQGDPGNISVLYGPGQFVAHLSDTSQDHGERHYWPWNTHGPLVHVPAGDCASHIYPEG